MHSTQQLAGVFALLVAGCTASVAGVTVRDPRIQAATEALLRHCCNVGTGDCDARRCPCGTDVAYTLWIDKQRFLIRVAGLDTQLGRDAEEYHWGSICPGGVGVLTSAVARGAGFSSEALTQLVPEVWRTLLQGHPIESGALRVECAALGQGGDAQAQAVVFAAILREFETWLAQRVGRGDLTPGQTVSLAIQPFRATDAVTFVVVEPLHEIWEVELIRDDSCESPVGVPAGYTYKNHRIESAETCSNVPRNCYTEADVDAIRRNAILRSVVTEEAPPKKEE